jgi:2',3'-cyclic-nucleotide 2'-phosphodiesterase (5'-nucleotidase family)
MTLISRRRGCFPQARWNVECGVSAEWAEPFDAGSMCGRPVPRWVALLLLLTGLVASAWGDTARLLILHTTDLHDHVRAGDHGLGGLPYVSGYIRQVRAERNDVLLVDSGDVTEKGDLVAFRTHSDLTYEALRRIGYDAITIGNHEHDAFGHSGLRRFEAILDQPLLCLNVLNPDGTTAFQASRLVEVNGVKVGLVGLLTPPTSITRKGEVLDFAASGEALAREARALRAAGAALVVAVCHERASRCAEWSRVAPEVDVFAAGHSHEALHTPVIVPGTGAIIVQSGSNARWVGWLDLEIDLTTRKIVRHEGRLVEMRHDAVPVDAEMLGWVRQREQELAPEARDLVFENPAEIDRFSIGRIGAEALRRAADADVGFCHPYLVIRNILPAGRVDVNAVFKTGGNRGHETVLVELTGAEIEGYADALERIRREPPEWAGFRMWREATPEGDALRTNLESRRRYRVIMAKLEWETRFLHRTRGLAADSFKAEPGKVTFTDAVCAYIRQVVAGGDTVQQRIAELGHNRQEDEGTVGRPRGIVPPVNLFPAK